MCDIDQFIYYTILFDIICMFKVFLKIWQFYYFDTNSPEPQLSDSLVCLNSALLG